MSKNDLFLTYMYNVYDVPKMGPKGWIQTKYFSHFWKTEQTIQYLDLLVLKITIGLYFIKDQGFHQYEQYLISGLRDDLCFSYVQTILQDSLDKACIDRQLYH